MTRWEQEAEEPCDACGTVGFHRCSADASVVKYRRALAAMREREAEAIVAALAGNPDDHGPGCDGPYNCVCSTDLQ